MHMLVVSSVYCTLSYAVSPMSHVPTQRHYVTHGGRQTYITANAQVLINNDEFGWQIVHKKAAPTVVDRYFSEAINAQQTCDVFCIHGVPAASLLFTRQNRHGDPVVDAFLLNRSMLQLFDAAPIMRRTLRNRYKCIDISHAKNRNEFLTIQ